MDVKGRSDSSPLQNLTEFDKKPDVLDHEIAEAVLSRPGDTDGQLAKKLGVSRATVNTRKKRGGAKKLIEESLALKRDSIESIAASALQKVVGHLSNPDPRISLIAAGLVLRSLDSLMAITTKEPNENKVIIYTAEWGGRTEGGE